MNTDLEAHQAGWLRNSEGPITSRSYPEIARVLGVSLCNRECVLRSLQSHTRGYVLRDGVVHWKNRSMKRIGLYNFLKLVAIRYGPPGDVPVTRAESLWMAAAGAYHLGLQVGVRFPREFGDTDRAQVREALAREGWRMDPDLKEKIERWAREAPG